MPEDNTVFVGKKGTMSYVLAVMTQLNRGAQEVTLKARGKAISRAVDVAEIVRNKFAAEIKISGITTTTEEVAASGNDSRPLKVSAIEIRLGK